uniref:Integrase catalytic domain-containing protein n=1 Tax=Trichuris muris TaxID=70415 RepID=A0A5S6QAE2_TRIMR
MELLRALRTKLVPTSAYHPQANVMVERLHRKLKSTSATHALDYRHWVGALPLVLLSFRAKEELRHAPAELVLLLLHKGTAPVYIMIGPRKLILSAHPGVGRAEPSNGNNCFTALPCVSPAFSTANEHWTTSEKPGRLQHRRARDPYPSIWRRAVTFSYAATPTAHPFLPPTTVRTPKTVIILCHGKLNNASIDRFKSAFVGPEHKTTGLHVLFNTDVELLA